MKKTMTIAATLMALAIAMSSCEPNLSDDKTYRPPKGEPGLGASFESKYVRYQKGQKHAGQTNFYKVETEWADTVWRNDRTHTQIVVWTNDDTFSDLKYEITDLTGSGGAISRDNIKMRFGSYILGHAAPGSCTVADAARVEIADALSDTPINEVTAEDPVKIWLTIDTPKDVAPGVYNGTFTVRGGETEHVLNISLTVADHTLPDVKDWNFHLDLWQFPYALMGQCSPAVEMGSDEYYALMEPFYRKLADAGQKVITTYIKGKAFYVDDSMVKWTKTSSGEWSFDYTIFDRHVEKMMEWGITGQISCFSLIGWDPSIPYYDEAAGSDAVLTFKGINAENPDGDPVIGSTEYRLVWTEFLNSFENHLKEKGWFEKTVFYMDENNHEDMITVIDFIKEHNEEWKIGLAGSSLEAEDEAKMYDYSIILGRQSTKNTPVTTFYTSCSHIRPNSYLTPVNNTAELPWLAWHAAGNGYDGFLRWAYDNWRTADPADAADTGATAGDCHMLYRLNNSSTENGVLTSIRFELLREGIQDYEKIKILNDAEVNAYAEGNFICSDISQQVTDAAEKVSRAEAILAKASMK